MVNMFFKVVAWQPEAEDWRVWQIQRRGRPRHERALERGTKRKTVQAAKESMKANELGLLTFIKDGETDSFFGNPDAFWRNAKKTEDFFGYPMLVVKQSPNGRWNAWSAGPTKGYRSIVVRGSNVKKDLVREAQIRAAEEDYIGVLVLDTNDRPSRFRAYMNAWGVVAEEHLDRDPAASMLEVNPIGIDL